MTTRQTNMSSRIYLYFRVPNKLDVSRQIETDCVHESCIYERYIVPEYSLMNAKYKSVKTVIDRQTVYRSKAT